MEVDDFGRLLEGERILWSGRPQQGLILTSRDWFLIPFSLLWGGFTVFWELSVLSQPRAPAFFPLFGGAFVLLGIYLVFGRFLIDAWIRRGIRYALTNRRILIVRSGLRSNVVSVNLDRLSSTRLSEGSGGRGTIQFGDPVPIWSQRNMGAWMPSLDPTPQFIGIEDVRDVFDTIQRALPAEARGT